MKRAQHCNRPGVETLEDRRLLSITFNGGILTVVGRSTADVVRFDRLADDSTKLQVTVNSAVRRYSFDDVKVIVCRTGGGDDDIRFNSADRIRVAAMIQAGVGDDLIIGGVGRDTIFGEAGDDMIKGASGNDSIDGGAGNDRIYGGPGNDTLFGRNGKDKLRGNGGNDLLYAGTGNDTLWGDDGDDRCHGGDGIDAIYGGDGVDSFYKGDDPSEIKDKQPEDNDAHDIL